MFKFQLWYVLLILRSLRVGVKARRVAADGARPNLGLSMRLVQCLCVVARGSGENIRLYAGQRKEDPTYSELSVLQIPCASPPLLYRGHGW
jgi:hypothetical protein